MTARVLAAAFAALVAMVGIHVVLLAASAAIAVTIAVLFLLIAARVTECGWGCAPFARGRAA